MHSVRNWARLFGAVSAIVFSTAAWADQPGQKSSASSGEIAEQTFRIYGQLNRAIMYWDDGRKSGTYAVDNDTSSSRLGFVGRHRLSGGLSTGYRVEVDTTLTSSSEVSRGDPWGDNDFIRLRHAYGYVEDSKLGRLTFGQQSPATDDITLLNLGSEMNDAALHYNNNFGIWLNLGPGLNSDLKWGQIAHNVDSLRGLFARYDTPAVGGFVLSAAWGKDGVWDVGARYQARWQSFRFVAGIGYMDDGEHYYRDTKGSASLIHDPTGFYISVAGGLRNDDVSLLSANGQARFHYAQFGISKQWLPQGKTTLYADYGLYRNFNVGNLLQADVFNPGQFVIWGTLAQTEVRRWGFGAEQSFDAHNLLIYAQAHHYEAEITGSPCSTIPPPSAGDCNSDPANLQLLPTKPWVGVVTGARIRF
jgi:predicted porin